jgi:flagellar biosynthesis protein FlhG
LADLDAQSLGALKREIMALAADVDVLVLDTGAGVSSRVVDFLRLAHDIVVVATPDIASMLDAYGILKVAHQAGLEAERRLLVNMVTRENEPDKVAERICGCARRFLGREPRLLGWLAQDPALQDANQHRRPLVLSRPDSESAKRLRRMAALLIASRAPAGRSPQHTLDPQKAVPAAGPAPAAQAQPRGAAHARP